MMKIHEEKPKRWLWPVLNLRYSNLWNISLPKLGLFGESLNLSYKVERYNKVINNNFNLIEIWNKFCFCHNKIYWIHWYDNQRQKLVWFFFELKYKHLFINLVD